MSIIHSVDVCCGLNWGDEAKGKIVAQLAKSKKYSFVCRWSGGHNAGHTVYVNGNKYKTHIVPCGIFYDIPSIIGPDCVVNIEKFYQEINYLKENGFNTNLIKISHKAHIVTEKHIQDDKQFYTKQGTTNNGIAPCYSDKYARKGKQAIDCIEIMEYLWDDLLFGHVLCEGAQGFWLDINEGNYPFVTSSTTLPYGACSLGFPPQLIHNIYGASKIYDTRVGTDPDFPETLLEDKELALIAETGNEYGVTTGRKRKVNWLNVDKLIEAINKSGTTIVIISKIDVLEKTNLFKFSYKKELHQFVSSEHMKRTIEIIIKKNCLLVHTILFSSDVEFVHNLHVK